MKKIRFYNNGTLTEESFKMMGVSVKADNTKIGKFGTGLKYAIAGVLRSQGSISIKTRKEDGETIRYVFTSMEKEIRGKKFDIVYCNGEQLAYATDYGHHWEAWQWFRELESNAIDEGGGSTDKPVGDDYDTVITVSSSEIAGCFKKRDEYFLSENMVPSEDIAGNQIFPDIKGKAFCKNVFVGEINAPFSVNFCDADITEDRTIQRADQQVASLVAQSKNKEVIDWAVQSHWPNFHAVWRHDKVSEEFLDAIEERIRNCRELPANLKTIHHQRRGEVELPSFEPTAFQQAKLDKALDFLLGANILVSQKINFVRSREGDSLFGYAKNGEIFLTEKAFEHGVHDLVQTVLEEYWHCETGHKDETREFQQFLFRKIVEQMEIATNTPL